MAEDAARAAIVEEDVPIRMYLPSLGRIPDHPCPAGFSVRRSVSLSPWSGMHCSAPPLLPFGSQVTTGCSWSQCSDAIRPCMCRPVDPVPANVPISRLLCLPALHCVLCCRQATALRCRSVPCMLPTAGLLPLFSVISSAVCCFAVCCYCCRPAVSLHPADDSPGRGSPPPPLQQKPPVTLSPMMWSRGRSSLCGHAV